MSSIEITKLSSRGQIVIPKSIRQELAWEAGDHLAVEMHGDRVILRRLNIEVQNKVVPIKKGQDLKVQSK
ncbi:MAG: antitoxin PrlF [Clostridia bacterium]|nr:antitoxin PrlF [Clostridia bacterium]